VSTNKTEIEEHFTIPFDNTLYIEPALLGAVKTRKLDYSTLRLEIPRNNETGKRDLLHPNSASPDITQSLPEKVWGIQHENSSSIDIKAIHLVFSYFGTVDFDVSGQQVRSKAHRETTEDVIGLFDSFCHWLWVFTAQTCVAASLMLVQQ
jgi:hypothetical protein